MRGSLPIDQPCEKELRITKNTINQTFSQRIITNGLCVLRIKIDSDVRALKLVLNERSNLYLPPKYFDESLEVVEKECLIISQNEEYSGIDNCKQSLAISWNDVRLISSVKTGNEFSMNYSSITSKATTTSIVKPTTKPKTTVKPTTTSTVKPTTTTTSTVKPTTTTTSTVKPTTTTTSTVKPTTTTSTVKPTTTTLTEKQTTNITRIATRNQTEAFFSTPSVENSTSKRDAPEDVNAGLIAGIVVSVLIIAIIVVGLVIFRGKKKAKKDVSRLATLENNSEGQASPSHYGTTTNVLYQTSTAASTQEVSSSQYGMVENSIYSSELSPPGGSNEQHYGMVENALYTSYHKNDSNSQKGVGVKGNEETPYVMADDA